MDNKKVIITQNISENLITQVQQIVPDWQIIVGRDPSKWEKHLNEAEIIVGWKKEVSDLVLQKESSLKWLQTWSAGVNNLPLNELHSRDIQLTSANGVHANPISETIFALMLGLTRKIHTYVKNQQTKTWHHANMKLEIHGKTIGIIGVGSIGKETAKIAKAFGMHVLGIRHSGAPVEQVDEMFTTDQLNSLLPKCDYVVVTLPLTSETQHLFGAEQFSLMKSTAYFINIGRGELVVEQDLIHALLEQQIAGAGLDVFTTEPLPEENPLWTMENVIVTPHTSGSTEHYDKRVIEDIFIPNLKKYIAKEPLSINVVDYKKGY
ncbi:D-2-hydroxyacid dehydrogenase [Halalkalibacter alkalisediminis]|uniref:D-2-hydroxyacid dehydrogenase n=1 Tax=Halalkalibacter alkalisediminis TaxID=935616 RepID=A0ABV6NC81_9BACI|nr:D-2-hydroxyacid dehydrogenase [Halalkalibacter alkalisediminis]